MLSELSIDARNGIRDFCSEFDLLELYEGSLHDAALCAWLLHLLAASMDIPRWFPKGKWATIQRLQQLCNDAACAELGRLMRYSTPDGVDTKPA